MVKLQQAWFVVIGLLLIAIFPAVAPYIAIITEFAGIHLADELLRPASVIFVSVS
jgi:hypothetical protein